MLCSGFNTMVTRPWLSWRFYLRLQQNVHQFSSSVAPPTIVPKPEETEEQVAKLKRSNSMVSAAFKSLKEPSKKPTFPSLDDHITAAQSIDALLGVANSSYVSKKHALKIVSVLADWAAEKKTKISEFESDPRFHKLCRMLGRNYKSNDAVREEAQSSGDLATVLEITGEDEAAKLVATISFEQMIKVMATLSLKKRRSTPLLRSLAFHICRSPRQLNIKQSADLLFAMSSLNFPDESLLDKVRNDVTESLPTNQKAAPVGSILTSLGLLRHKDPALLDGISEWMARNCRACRPQDLVSFLLTLAHVGYTPSNAAQAIQQVRGRLLTPQDVPSLSSWLDAVWALCVIGHLDPHMVSTVLDPEFVAKLQAAECLTVAAKLKLLNINAVAKLEMTDYTGPLLKEGEIVAPLGKSKNKETLVRSVIDSLGNLLSSQTYLAPARDSGMGFMIEGECLVDAKGNPLPVTDTKESAKRKKASRIALLVWDYADLCRGVADPTGPNSLAVRLLQKQGLKVVAVPHTEFNPQEKLVQRVQYLEQRIKSLAKSSVI